MPFTTRLPSNRPLNDALGYIEASDGCTRAEASEQFRQMVMSKGHHPFRLQCLWGDRKPDPSANIDPVPMPSENIGPYPRDWEGATLEADGRARFAAWAEPRLILVPWNDFIVAWGSYKSRADPAEAYIQEQAARIHAARLKQEADDHRWRQKCAEEYARPIQERQCFSFAEIAHQLACDPRTLLVDPELSERIVRELTERVMTGHFAVAEVTNLYGDPPDFHPVHLRLGDYLVPDGEALFLTRTACQRYLEARTELPGARRLLHDWFPAEERGLLKPSADRSIHEPTTTREAATKSEERSSPAQPTSTAAIKAFVEQFLKDEGQADRGPTKFALLECWKAAGYRGWRDELLAEFNDQMGDDAPKRGRPKKSQSENPKN